MEHYLPNKHDFTALNSSEYGFVPSALNFNATFNIYLKKNLLDKDGRVSHHGPWWVG